MSKYITHFQTEAAYQAALPTLDLPNVSLVDELNEVHYHRALYGAHAGDICLYDVAEGQKIVVTAENWNLTDYPTASYPIVGIVAKNEGVDGVTIFSIKYPDAQFNPTLDNTATFKWQNINRLEWGTEPTYILNTSSSLNSVVDDFNGKTNTNLAINAIKAYDAANDTDNITGNVGELIEKFYVEGTTPGEWYIPSGGELNLFNTNSTALYNTIDVINTASSSLCKSSNDFIARNSYFLTSNEGRLYAYDTYNDYRVLMATGGSNRPALVPSGNFTPGGYKYNPQKVILFYKL